jgi:hypothetical protein
LRAHAKRLVVAMEQRHLRRVKHVIYARRELAEYSSGGVLR